MLSEDEVREMIGKLEEERETLPEVSMFGDHNWETMDAQIAVLEQVLEDRDDVV